ncbi:MAG: LTA synthase family protein [Chitinophagaceae bacterium]|nr:LTA synthase family protein [Chitinophagaceae bacterium]
MFLSEPAQIGATFIKSILFDVLSNLLYFTPYLLLLLLFTLLFKQTRKAPLLLLNVYYSVLFWFVSILSLADIFYYKFNLRRINLEVLTLMRDSKASIVHFAAGHPEAIVLLIMLMLLYYLSIKKTSLPPGFSHNISFKNVILAGLAFCALILFIFLKFAKYFSPLSSSLIVAPGYTGLYTNSPQVFIYSFRSGWTYVKPLQYFTDEEADQRVPVFYAGRQSIAGQRNVIVFILESFSYSYLDADNPEKPATPFFDSLIRHSIFFTNAYANNTTSANGLCSILTGLPSLTNQPFFSSPYAGNPIDAAGIALSKKGYETSFFLGANEDHFGFKKGTKLLGIEHYYNGETFPAAQQDGTWGVFDGPFLQYFAQTSSQISEPFFSVFFTISTHYPFKIPDSLEQQFSGKHHYDNERAVSYVDNAFSLFFEKVKNTDWFKNTVFIFTGDHVSKENKRERQHFNFNSYFHIPLFIFDPQNTEGRTVSHLVQHTDIPATIADITGLEDTILCFGRSMFDCVGNRYTVNRYSENIVQMIDTAMLIQYDIQADRLLDIYKIGRNDELEKETDSIQLSRANKEKIPLLKAYMQQYFNRLYYNRLFKKK